MKTKIITLVLAFGAATCLLKAQEAGPPVGAAPLTPPAQSPAAPAHHRIHILPPGARERLELTDDQRKLVDALEADVQAKLEKILTPQQMQQLQRMHPPRGRGGPGRDGPGGGPDGPDGGDRPPPPSPNGP